jgi:phosphate transport system ATP-binding protein
VATEKRNTVNATTGAKSELAQAAARPAAQAAQRASASEGDGGRLTLKNVSARYGSFRAVKDVTLAVRPKSVTALIGPSGCGKSTLIRTINRMHETLPGATVSGSISLDGVDLYSSDVDPVRARRVVGMVFQKPNPFPTMSISENVSSGLRLTGGTPKSEIAGIVEDSLRRAALWDEVKEKLNQPGTSLSGGQQQRLCIARTIAVKPRVVLMDEPCSALDPVATLKIEELIRDLAAEYTIVIVTHNMQQASRVSDETAFFSMDDDRAGYLVETGPTAEMFTNPKQALTEGYIQGRFG